MNDVRSGRAFSLYEMNGRYRRLSRGTSYGSESSSESMSCRSTVVGLECRVGASLVRDVRSDPQCDRAGHGACARVDQSSHLGVGRRRRGKGGTATYGFESNAPAELGRFFGWNKRSLTAGDQVTIDYAPLKSGRNGGALRTLTFADGRVLRTPRSNPQYGVGLGPPTASGGSNEAK